MGDENCDRRKSKMSAGRRKKRALARSAEDGPANIKHKEVSPFLVCEVLPDYVVGWLFFDVYRHLAELDDETDQPRLT